MTTPDSIFSRLSDRFTYQILGRSHTQQIIFGIGLSKSGTTSLTDALSILGYSTIHYPPIVKFIDKQPVLRWPWWMNKYNAMSDIPCAALYKELHQKYPEAKFVLTIREKSEWLKSCRKHFTYEAYSSAKEQDRFKNGVKLNEYVYGKGHFDEAIFSVAYDAHHKNSRSYFKQKNNQFLELEIGGESNPWGPLCEFLRVEEPKIAFPRSNQNLNLANS